MFLPTALASTSNYPHDLPAVSKISGTQIAVSAVQARTNDLHLVVIRKRNDALHAYEAARTAFLCFTRSRACIEHMLVL
jgi:hypothetical protein